MNMQEGLEGNPVAGTIKKFSRIFAFLIVPITMHCPKVNLPRLNLQILPYFSYTSDWSVLLV